ncbi:hypothetical protein BZA77DRAFT_161382 [Pyronema omphalodes]|nr:hypothetical protein BZA77DRAFT_161382 [Pyronema omphalodes]
MSNGAPRKRDVLDGKLKSWKGYFQQSKKTKEKNSGSSQTNKTTANAFRASVQAPSDLSPTSSVTPVATAVLAPKAQIQATNEHERFQSNLASRFGQPHIAATVKHEERTDVGNIEAQKHNSTATGIMEFQSLWIKALSSKDLDEDRETLNSLNLQTNALDTLSEATSFVQNILYEKNRKAWKIEIKGEVIVLRDIAMKLLGWMERFKGIGDIMAQCDPIHAGLPWAGVRFLLEVCMDNQNTMDAIFVGLENIAGLIHRCTLYELLYLREESRGSKNLEVSMIRLYIAILKFLARAVRKLKQSCFEAPFHVQDISDYLEDIEKCEKAVGCDAAVASDQSTRTDLAHLRAQLENIDNKMLHIQPQLHNIQDWLEESERSSILEWISNTPYTSHHERINLRRLEGTGMWLLKRDDYRAWISSSVSKLLLLRGTPGAGKTYIASKVIDSLHSDTTGMTLAYFYCNRAEDNRRKPDSILRTIIQQLAQPQFDKSRLIKPIVDIYQDRKSKGQMSSSPSLAESRELLVQLTDIHPLTMICIDALDEVAEDERIHLLKALNYVIAKSKNLVKIFATTRMDPEIIMQFKIFPRIELQPDNNFSDIEKFIETEVQRAIDDGELLCGVVSDDLKAEICQVLRDRSKGMFQLAALHITSLRQAFTAGDVRRGLQTLPGTLTAAYNDIYHSIQRLHSSRLALSAFRWIQCSYEPLRTSTLLDAITVEVGRPGEFSRTEPINANSLLKLCQNLLVLDERLDVFRFAHLSVQEYLETRPELSRATSHTEIAEGCLSLLCTPSSWDDYEEVEIKKQDYRNRHLLSYSTLFWLGTSLIAET